MLYQDSTSAVSSPRLVEADEIQVLRDELSGYYQTLKGLNQLPPTVIFQTLAGISARLCEVRGQLNRTDTRRYQAIRTKEIDPLIEEIDRLFKIYSRIESVRDFEWRLSGGGM